MAYSTNILPKSSAYYTLSNASVNNSELSIESGGYAEIRLTQQMLPKLTSKMLVVVHPSVFSDGYTNDVVQVTLSIITLSGTYIEYLIPVSFSASGVFNTEIDLPEEEYTTFTYRISSSVPVTIYNWELCAEEAMDLTTVIDGVEQELPKLLYDYNMYAYAVSQRELTVGLISCYLLNATDLQGHFTISFFATERCNVHVRIKDNSVTELYAPLVYTVEKGYASISVPHAYLKKLATDHSFSVTMQCSNGQLSIPVRGMLYTIDGGYLATRLLDAGVDIEDISIKQLSTDQNPSEIWAIGFEGSRLIVKKRVYSQLQRENWEAVKDLGEGLRAGIEFHGDWTVRAGSDKYTLETDITPYVFIVGLDNVLRVFSDESFGTVTELDSEVTALSVCQGFSSWIDTSQDQGLVVAYVKNGNVFYRQLNYSETASGLYWQPIETLYDNGDALSVNVHRLPDYRLGICVEHSSGTKWYITGRTYVGQGIKPEISNVSVESRIIASVFDVSKAHDTVYWVATQNTFEESRYYNNFVMTFDGPLIFLSNTDVSTLKDSLKVYINNTVVSTDAIGSIDLDYNVLSVKLKEDVLGGRTVRIDFNCPSMLMRAYNGHLGVIQQSYSWTLTLPIAYLSYEEENIGVGVQAAVSLDVMPLVTTNLMPIETPTVGLEATLDLEVHEIITQNEPYKETCTASVSGQVDLLVTLVGITPI